MELFRLFGTIALNDNGVENQLGSVDKKASNVGQTFGKIAKTIAIAGIAIATAIGVKAFSAADNLQKAMNGLQAQTGITDDAMKGYEDTLLNIYNNNFGESFEDIANSMATVKQNTGLAGKELQTMTEGAIALRDTFEFEVNESTRTAQSLMKNFGISGKEAYDLIAFGAQNGANKNGDLLDTFNEYAPQFQAMGFSAEQFTEVLVEGAESGAFSIDKVGDAMKEFNIRSKDGSKTTMDAFTALGLNAEQLSKQFAQGGEQGQKAFALVTEKLNNVQDPLQKNQIGVALFGTQFEDLEAKGIEALTQISAKGVDASGTLDKINQIKYNTFGEALTGIGRNLETGIIIPIGQKVLPVLNNFGNWINSNMPGIKDTITSLFDKLGSAIKVVADNANWLIPIISGLVSALVTFQIINGVNAAIATTKTLIDAWKASTFAQTIAQNGLNAALLANPIGLVVAAVGLLIGAGVALYMNWGKVKTYASSLWATIKSKFQAIGDSISNTWNKVKQKTSQVWQWIKNHLGIVLPAIGAIVLGPVGVIVGGIIGNWGKIKITTVSAFNSVKNTSISVWNGIKSSISSIVNAIKSVVSSVFKSILSVVTSIWNSIKSTTSSVWNGLKSIVTNVANGVKGTISSVFNGIKSTVVGVWNGIKSVTSSVWNGIKSAITTPINAAKNAVSSAVNSIKAFFANLKIKAITIPKIKLPHFSLDGKFSLMPPSVPKLNVKWFKDGGILTKPTIFGMAGNRLLGGGEAGMEAILPISRLDDLMAKAIVKANASVNTPTKVINQTNVFNSPKSLDYAEMNRLLRRENQKMQLLLGAEV